MTRTGLPGTELRERHHLDPFVKDEFEARTGQRPVARKLGSDAFIGLGAVDVVIEQPACLMELKWSYDPPGKVFESVWDAVKLAILGPAHGYDHLFLATGASLDEWGRAECKDLFDDGPADLLGMWGRPLVPPRGPNNGMTVGEDLVIGGRGNQPTRAPSGATVRKIGAFLVAGDFELRVIAVEGSNQLHPWPQIDYQSASRPGHGMT